MSQEPTLRDQLIKLLFEYGYTERVIGNSLGITESMVKSTISRYGLTENNELLFPLNLMCIIFKDYLIEDMDYALEHFKDNLFSLLKNKKSSGFNKNESLTIIKYYYDGKSLEEIGDELGVSKQRVQQLKTSAIKKLRFLNNIYYLLGKIDEPVKNDSIDMLGLSPRTYNTLTGLGIKSVDTLRKMGYEKFLTIEGFGPKCIAELVNCLINYK